MSNHAGGYMLNEVLHIMDEYHILENLSNEARCNFLRAISKMAVNSYDCDYGEILEGIGKRYKICYWCFKETDLKEDDICAVCCPE